MDTWISEDSKNKLDKSKELFFAVKWFKYVLDPNNGYWEKGLVSVPLVAYTLSDKATYKKIKVHFGYTEDDEEFQKSCRGYYSMIRQYEFNAIK